jgi:Spy/CpxP family protein refolding chaperone
LPDRGKGWPYVAIAVVGLAIGFAASSLAYRVGWLRVPHQPFIERIQRELNLTPSQREQVLQIVQDTRLKVENLRHEFQRQRRDVLTQARERVRALLTPEQQEKFDRDFKPPPERQHEGGPGMHDRDNGPPVEEPPEGAGPPP